MKNHLIIFNLFASVPKGEWEYFKGWICLNLASYSDRHSQWFLILWGVWTKEIEKTISREDLSPEDVASAHVRIDPDRLSIDDIRQQRMGTMQERYEKNLRSNFVDLIKEYLGLQQIRKDKLLIEKEALFSMARSAVPGTYHFYKNKFLSRLLNEPTKNAGLLKILKHLLDIDTEYIYRHPKEKSLAHNQSFNSGSISEISWIADITEKSLPDLLNRDLSDLQTFAFGRLTKMVDNQQQLTESESESITIASSAHILVFFFQWSITKEKSTIEDLREGLSILDKSCPLLEQDFATNCIYAFHNIISTKISAVSPSNHAELDQLQALQTQPYELAMKHKNLAYLLTDYFNLVRIYLKNIDRLIGQKRVINQAFSLAGDVDIQHQISKAESSILGYLHKVPTELRPSVRSQLQLIFTFYQENHPKFDQYKREYMTKYHGLSLLFNLNSEWHILKYQFGQLGENNLATNESEALSQSMRNISKKCKRLLGSNKDYALYLSQLSESAELLGGYLRAKRKNNRLEWLNRIQESTTLLDKNWILWKTEGYENENP